MSKKNEQTYEVISPLLHDGKSYRRGDKVSMSPDDAEALVATGVLSAIEEPPADDGGDGEKNDDAADAQTGGKKGKGTKK